MKVVITAREEVLACDCEFSAVHNTLSHAAKVRVFTDNISASVAFWCMGVLGNMYNCFQVVVVPSFRVRLMSLLCLSWSICKPGRVFVQPIMLDTHQLEQCGARMHVANDTTLEDQVETKQDTLRLRFKFAWGLAMVDCLDSISWQFCKPIRKNS